MLRLCCGIKTRLRFTICNTHYVGYKGTCTMPFFSIVIPSYNNARYISECLDSLLSQSFNDWEAIVVDDGSSDGSPSIIQEYALRDVRVKLVGKRVNEGSHLARCSGVDESCGQYVLFLDADDILFPDALNQIAQRLQENSVDIFHFGTKVFNADMPGRICEDVENHGNISFPPLKGESIVEAAFLGIDEKQQDWRVLQRAFSSELIKKAFSAMTKERLGRGQDSYEYFVISSLAQNEITDNSLIGYGYHFGRGVTNLKELDSDGYTSIALQFKSCIDAVADWAESFKQYDLSRHADRHKELMLELLVNDWNDRVRSDQKEHAAEALIPIIGAWETATQLARISRDEAYEDWVKKRPYDESAPYITWSKFASKIASRQSQAAPPLSYTCYSEAAYNHIEDIRKRSLSEKLTSEPKLLERIKQILGTWREAR